MRIIVYTGQSCYEASMWETSSRFSLKGDSFVPLTSKIPLTSVIDLGGGDGIFIR